MYRGSWLIGLSLFLLFSLPLQAREESGDTLVQKPKYHLAALTHGLEYITDGIVTTVRHTGRKIRKVGKEFNNIDTTYISPNRYNLAFMLEHSTWYEHYRLGSKEDNQTQSIAFSPTMGNKLGIYFGWRWIFLGYTFDADDLFGKNKDKVNKTEMSLNLYSSKFGIDLYYRKTGSDFKIRSTEGLDFEQPHDNLYFDGLKSKIKGLNAYWIFNYKRFSYPAAYSQSTNQRKSAGSFMLGFAYSKHHISFDYRKLPEEIIENLNDNLKFNSVKYSDYSLGFGYGYNWVFAKDWVSNLSLLPGIGFKKAKVNDRDFGPNDWIKDINFDLITRAGIVYNNSKYYVGASLVLHTYDYRKLNLSVTNSFGTLRIYAGFNFWRKKEFKKKK